MSRAEKYIQEHTKVCSNEIEWEEGGLTCHDYASWLTSDQARKAVEIERNEILLNVAEWIKDTFIFSKDAKKDFSQTFNIKLL